MPQGRQEPLSSLTQRPQDALEPHIDAATMKFHHDFHHQAYVNNLNKVTPAQTHRRVCFS